MSIIRIRNPIAESVEQKVTPARRLGDLNGKRIGLFWNAKSGGDVALAHVEELLKTRHPNARFSHYLGDVGFAHRLCTPAAADRIVKEVDAIVGTTAD
jgi:hypothetical protein